MPALPISVCAQAVWYLKCRALTLKNWIDDTEIDEEVTDEGCSSTSVRHLRLYYNPFNGCGVTAWAGAQCSSMPFNAGCLQHRALLISCWTRIRRLRWLDLARPLRARRPARCCAALVRLQHIRTQ